MANSYDIVIIGAGAAGVAAGRTLAQTRCSFVIVEARARIGGRAHTVNAEGMALDLGCGWLHAAAHNVWRREALAAGFEIDAVAPPWGRNLQASAHRDAFAAAMAAFSARIENAVHDADRPAADYLEPGNSANEMIEAVCTYLNGVTLEHVSAHDYLRYDGEGGNERAKMGYGALISALGGALPIEMSAAARLIDHSGALIRIETDRGVLEAKAVIVCVPTPIIAAEVLRFMPTLRPALALAGGLPLGVVDKMFIGFDDGAVPAGEGRMFARAPSLSTPSYDVRPMGRPVIEAFLAGPLAAALEREGPRGAADFVLNDLASLGGGDLRGALRVLAASDWGRDPWARGAYSYARPGYAEARTALAEPMAERIFFAGEACAPAYFGTAHGAAETAIAAAGLALDHLQRI